MDATISTTDEAENESSATEFMQRGVHEALVIKHNNVSGNARAHFGDVWNNEYHQHLYGASAEPHPHLKSQPTEQTSYLKTFSAALAGTWIANLTTEYIQGMISWLLNGLPLINHHIYMFACFRSQSLFEMTSYDAAYRIVCQETFSCAIICASLAQNDDQRRYALSHPFLVIEALSLSYLMVIERALNKWLRTRPQLFSASHFAITTIVSLALSIELWQSSELHWVKKILIMVVPAGAFVGYTLVSNEISRLILICAGDLIASFLEVSPAIDSASGLAIANRLRAK